MLLQIDMDSFTDMAVFLRQASDHILKVSLDLKAISENAVSDQQIEDVWKRIIIEMMALNTKITLIENVLRAIFDEHKANDSQKLPN